MVASGIAGALLGGLLDRETAKKTNAANLQATQATINDQRQSREEARQDLTGQAGDVVTTRNPGGGFNSGFERGSGSDLLQRGDIGRAGAANEASTDFNFNVPNLQAAQGIVDRDNQLAQSSFDDAFNKATLRQIQDKGQESVGTGSTNFNPRLAAELGRVADKFKLNREQNALGLLNTSRQADIGTLEETIRANQALAPTIKGPGTSASAINASIPTAPQTADLSGAVTPRAGSNIVAQIQAQLGLEEDQKRRLERIRAIPRGAINFEGEEIV